MWEDINPQTLTGFSALRPDLGSGGVTSGVDSSVATDAGPQAPASSPESPLFWFAVLLVLAGGAIYVVHHVKVGGNLRAGPVKGDIAL